MYVVARLALRQNYSYFSMYTRALHAHQLLATTYNEDLFRDILGENLVN